MLSAAETEAAQGMHVVLSGDRLHTAARAAACIMEGAQDCLSRLQQRVVAGGCDSWLELMLHIEFRYAKTGSNS
jgi:hypothetical protein